MPSPTLHDLACNWLTVKQLASTSDADASTAARRGDLARFARILAATIGHNVADTRTFNLADELAPLTVTDLSAVDNITQALGTLKLSYAPATATRTLSTVRGFCAWLVARGHMTADPTRDDTVALPPQHGDRPYHAFQPGEVDAMRAAAAVPPDASRSAWPARDVAIIEVLAGCGLRAGELCALHQGDVDRTGEHPALHLSRNTKGGRGRRVPLPDRADTALNRYLTERATPEPYMFTRRNGRRLNIQFIDRLVERVATQAGVARPEHVAAHGFRHYYGTQLALRGVPGPVIQELMGHADPRVTAIYTRSVGRHLNQALEDAGWF